METPLLATKLVVPTARPGLVPRPHLIERLGEGLGFSLVLVSAPAGFGKTTLLSEWARSSQLKARTAWVSLDEGDNDPVRFWDYLVAALQTLQPGCGERILPWLHTPEPPPIQPILTALINDFSRARCEFFIILDDYHLIQSQQVHDGITYFIEHLPAGVHLVIATRTDPPLRLAHFRGRGLMLEVRTDDLRFTLDDAANLLKELKAPGLSAGEIAALNERTEGWVVGLKMAALSMSGQKDVPGFLAAFTGSQRYIMDYLLEEVLQKQPPELRDFLMKTSVLGRLTGPLCDDLTGRKDSKQILLSLEREHLFIVPLDETRQWYRFEHLFADLLRHQCEIAYGAEQVAALHRQASQWFEDNNLPDEAIHHALKAKDWQRAMGLISVHGEARRKRGEFNTLLGWLQVIPDEILRERLRLYSQYAALLAAVGRLEAAEAVLGYLESAALDDTTKGEAAFTRGIVYRHRGDQRCIELFEKSYALLPPDDVAMRGRAAISIAHVLQRYSRFQEAEQWATQAYELGRQAGDFLVVMESWSQTGIVNAYQGKLKRAAEAFKKSNGLAEQKGLAFASYDMSCWVQYILNDLEGSTENARLAIEQNTADLTAFFIQAQVCLARGDTAEAEAVMKKLDEASRHLSIDSRWYANYIAWRVIYAIQRGNVEEAAEWGERLPDLASMMLVVRPFSARLLLAQGKREAAAELLEELYESAVRLSATLVAIQIRIYQALAADNGAVALDFLSEALTMAEPEGIIRYFVDEGKLLKSLLEKVLDKGITPDFTMKLLDIIKAEERQRQAMKQAAASPPPPGLLSERELEVLRLLATDVPNQRIAAKLSVSLGTVKTHVHHIIEKLEVKDRRQAVQRAKDLKLI